MRVHCGIHIARYGSGLVCRGCGRRAAVQHNTAGDVSEAKTSVPEIVCSAPMSALNLSRHAGAVNPD